MVGVRCLPFRQYFSQVVSALRNLEDAVDQLHEENTLLHAKAALADQLIEKVALLELRLSKSTAKDFIDDNNEANTESRNNRWHSSAFDTTSRHANETVQTANKSDEFKPDALMTTFDVEQSRPAVESGIYSSGFYKEINDHHCEHSEMHSTIMDTDYSSVHAARFPAAEATLGDKGYHLGCKLQVGEIRGDFEDDELFNLNPELKDAVDFVACSENDEEEEYGDGVLMQSIGSSSIGSNNPPCCSTSSDAIGRLLSPCDAESSSCRFSCCKFGSTSDLEQHMLEFHGEECSSSSMSLHRINAASQLRGKTTPTSYKCSLCQLCFSERTLLIAHWHTEHPMTSSVICDYCGEVFNSNEALNEHAKVHNLERPHECLICGKRFTRKDILTNHLRTHTNEKPYVCPYQNCTKAFRMRSVLWRHKKMHEYRERLSQDP